MIAVVVPIKTERGLNNREHWRVAHRRKVAEQDAVTLALAGHRRALAALKGRPVVTLTRVSAGELDGDNLRGALKAVRDAVAKALGRDDHEQFIGWEYAQERCPLGRWGVRIEVRAEKVVDDGDR